jgi:hypothetical protein
MNIKQAAIGIQHMDEYLNEASAATVLWDVGVLLGRIAAQGEEIKRMRHALEMIAHRRHDGTPAYGDVLMCDLANDALEDSS